jgi:hypothetical protein
LADDFPELFFLGTGSSEGTGDEMMIWWGWASGGETFTRFTPPLPTRPLPLDRSPASGLSPNSDSFSSPSLPYRQIPSITAWRSVEIVRASCLLPLPLFLQLGLDPFQLQDLLYVDGVEGEISGANIKRAGATGRRAAARVPLAICIQCSHQPVWVIS